MKKSALNYGKGVYVRTIKRITVLSALEVRRLVGLSCERTTRGVPACELESTWGSREGVRGNGVGARL